jgi:hypothetical protein
VLCVGIGPKGEWCAVLHRHSSSRRHAEGEQLVLAVCKAYESGRMLPHVCVRRGRWHAALHRHSSRRHCPEGGQKFRLPFWRYARLAVVLHGVGPGGWHEGLHRHSSSRRHPVIQQEYCGCM